MNATICLLEEVYGDDYKAMLRDFIPYLEQTADEDWCIDVVRTKDNKANCLFGHLSNFCGHSEHQNVMTDFDWFESRISTTYVIYAINDGNSNQYRQATPKQRCIAYLRDLLTGKELTVHFAMQKWIEEHK